MKPTILAAKVNYKLMVDIKCLLTVATVVPCLMPIKALVVFAQSPSAYVCDFTKTLNLCIQDMHGLYCLKKAFGCDAFACFVQICELSYESIRLRWHPDVNDCVEHLVFEGRLSTSVGSHLSAICIDPQTSMRTFVSKESFVIIVSKVKAKVIGACL